jgi:hypothetical protein
MLLGFSVGCSKGTSEKSTPISMDGEVVLISNGKNENFLTISTYIQNNQNKEMEPFYVEFKINDKWLSSKLEDNKFIVGDEIVGEDGKLFTIKQNSGNKIGGTYKIISPVDEKKLKTAIEKDNAVEAILLSQDKKEIMTCFINKYWKEIRQN